MSSLLGAAGVPNPSRTPPFESCDAATSSFDVKERSTTRMETDTKDRRRTNDGEKEREKERAFRKIVEGRNSILKGHKISSTKSKKRTAVVVAGVAALVPAAMATKRIAWV